MQFPPDGEADDSFKNMDSRVAQRHVDTFYGVADALAHTVADDPVSRESIVGACAASSPIAESCLSDFVRDFGSQVFRRPLTDDERDRFMELHAVGGSDAEIVHAVLFTLLMSPQMVYHLELDGSDIDGRSDLYALDGYAIASRLSYHFWQSMPDAELMAAAESGELETTSGYEAQVQRLFEHQRTKENGAPLLRGLVPPRRVRRLCQQCCVRIFRR